MQFNQIRWPAKQYSLILFRHYVSQQIIASENRYRFYSEVSGFLQVVGSSQFTFFLPIEVMS